MSLFKRLSQLIKLQLVGEKKLILSAVPVYVKKKIAAQTLWGAISSFDNKTSARSICIWEIAGTSKLVVVLSKTSSFPF